MADFRMPCCFYQHKGHTYIPELGAAVDPGWRRERGGSAGRRARDRGERHWRASGQVCHAARPDRGQPRRSVRDRMVGFCPAAEIPAYAGVTAFAMERQSSTEGRPIRTRRRPCRAGRVLAKRRNRLTPPGRPVLRSTTATRRRSCRGLRPRARFYDVEWMGKPLRFTMKWPSIRRLRSVANEKNATAHQYDNGRDRHARAEVGRSCDVHPLVSPGDHLKASPFSPCRIICSPIAAMSTANSTRSNGTASTGSNRARERPGQNADHDRKRQSWIDVAAPQNRRRRWRPRSPRS